MIEKEIVIKNKTGLHARPAAIFVETADHFESEMELVFEEITVNAKSIIGVLSLGIGYNEKVLIRIYGKDEEEALEKILEMVENKFGESDQ